MFDLWHFVLFLSAAGVLALMPGPGIFYVAARTLAGGRGEGLASSFGTGLGGFVHIVAGAIGVSAIVMASAEAFTALKIVGALYLVYLGIKTWREAGAAPELGNGPAMGALNRVLARLIGRRQDRVQSADLSEAERSLRQIWRYLTITARADHPPKR